MSDRILKPGWQWVKFGDVVRLNTERCADPAAAGIERYVGLEHIDPEDLRIRRWGLVAEGTTFTNRFRPGQVLFGKRRAYQRKVAVADFEGVCSGDIYVFEPKDDRLLPELLPFICQTEAFCEHAVGTSAGSLSPRTNWDQLTNFNFALPPKETQPNCLRLLNSAFKVNQALSDLAQAAEAVRQLLLLSTFVGGETRTQFTDIDKAEFPDGWRLVPASQLSSALVTKGATPGNALTKIDTGIPFIKVYNLTFDGTLDFSVDPTFVAKSGHQELERSQVRAGDVLMNIVGPPLGKVSVVPSNFPQANINQAIVRFRPLNAEMGLWLACYLQSPWAQRWLAMRSKKTSGQQNLTLEICRDLPVPVPPQLEFSKWVSQLAVIDQVRQQVLARVGDSKPMRKNILNSVISGTNLLEVIVE